MTPVIKLRICQTALGCCGQKRPPPVGIGLKRETVEAVETRQQKNLQKPVPRAAAAYGRQLKIKNI